MGWTEAQYQEHLQRERQRNHNNPDSSQGASPIAQQTAWYGPLAAGKVENDYPRRFVVRVTSVRRRLLDEDNLAAKFFTDGCRYAGVLPSDAPGKTSVIEDQRQVKSKTDECTEIRITVIHNL